jgi:hypothetical protein
MHPYASVNTSGEQSSKLRSEGWQVTLDIATYGLLGDMLSHSNSLLVAYIVSLSLMPRPFGRSMDRPQTPSCKSHRQAERSVTPVNYSARLGDIHHMGQGIARYSTGRVAPRIGRLVVGGMCTWTTRRELGEQEEEEARQPLAEIRESSKLVAEELLTWSYALCTLATVTGRR